MKKHSNWTMVTKYYRQNLVPFQSFNVGGKEWKIMRMANTLSYYLVNHTHVTKIPTYVVKTLMGRDDITCIIGPYIFLNNFEDTSEGKYLIRMLPHWFNRKDIVEQKITSIMSDYGYWVRVNAETTACMKMWFDAGRMYQIRRAKEERNG